MGNFVNYIEVGADDEDTESESESPNTHLVYSNEIPTVFLDPEATEQFLSSDHSSPPQLPPQLETSIINTNSLEKEDSSVLPVPNHVVINHLTTTSIKHNMLAVASTSRYSKKFGKLEQRSRDENKLLKHKRQQMLFTS